MTLTAAFILGFAAATALCYTMLRTSRSAK